MRKVKSSIEPSPIKGKGLNEDYADSTNAGARKTSLSQQKSMLMVIEDMDDIDD